MNNISLRLKTIGEVVLKTKSKGIIDVGCDHALLDIFLYQKDPSLNLIASDNKEEPLLKAKSNIKKFGLEKEIQTLLSDGISAINKEVDTAIISGMGAETIIRILNHENIKYLNRLIISSNNKYSLLRKTIVEMGFVINDEIIIEDEKYYQVIEFIRGKEVYSKKEIEYGPILLKNKNPMFYEYYNNILNKLENILKKIPSGRKKSSIEEEIKVLKDLLN